MDVMIDDGMWEACLSTQQSMDASGPALGHGERRTALEWESYIYCTVCEHIRSEHKQPSVTFSSLNVRKASRKCG